MKYLICVLIGMALVWLWPRLQGRLKGIGVNLTPPRDPPNVAPLITVAAAPPSTGREVRSACLLV